MEEYSTEFENLIVNEDLREFEEKAIAPYLAGLSFNIARVIYLQSYHTLHHVIKIALKVKALSKYGSSTTNKNVAKEGFVKRSISMNPSDTKTTLKPQVKSEVHKPQQESTSKSSRGFNC